MNWTQLIDKAGRHGLMDMGRLHDAGDTVVLLGADRTMWPIFRSCPEYSDDAPDPLDRWSKRVIGNLARQYDVGSVYPSDGPPYAPFIAWARATGRFWQSPTGMLIHDVAGLMVSIRGALRISGEHSLRQASPSNPCDTCVTRPCVTACPVNALSADAMYDVPACKTYLAAPDGKECMTQGCIVRRACPVSASFDRDPEQSAFHMRAFMGL